MSNKFRTFIKKRPAVVLTICLGVVLSLMTSIAVWRSEAQNMATEFDQEARERVSVLSNTINNSLHDLQSIAAFYAASREVERHEFREFVAPNLSYNRANIQAFEWIPRVTAPERETYEEAARQEGLTGFQITEKNAEGQMVRAATRAEYFPVYFVEPYKGNEAALGFDLASNPARLKSLNTSRDSGQAVATASITLVQETATQKGFLIFQPVYRKDTPTDTVALRRNNLRGFALGVFRIIDLMEAGIKHIAPEGLDVWVFDKLAAQGAELLYFHSSRARQESLEYHTKPNITTLQKGLYHTAALKVAGQEWLVIVKPMSGQLTIWRCWHFWARLSGGLFLTAFLVRYISERKRTEEQANLAAQYWQETFDAVDDLIIIIDKNCKIVRANRTVNEAFAGTEVIGAHCHNLIHGTNEPIPECPAQQAFRCGKTVRAELQEPHLGNRWFDAQAYPVTDESGTVQQVVHIVHDITERKQAEEKLKKTMAELERSNADLQQFAYVASHDLQEPLRMVTSYTQLLSKRYGDKLDDKGKEFIHFAVDGATRMQKLIVDLLNYSRVTSRAKDFEVTDCEAVLKDTLADLQFVTEESGSVITHDSLPALMADTSQIGQVFQNIIGNAIKFRGEEKPEIHIGAKQKDGEWVFSIRDNGIGIDPEQADRVFAVFQRLHTTKEHPGTGIGLAICKKIVERHGGRIWLESEPGKGSIFHFTIPKQNIADPEPHTEA